MWRRCNPTSKARSSLLLRQAPFWHLCRNGPTGWTLTISDVTLSAGAGFVVAIAGSMLLMPGLASAQDVTEPALKAAFIYNFAKFTEWPSGLMPTGQPLVMCVLGDAAVGDALERAVKGRELAGRRMTVWRATPADPQRVCHVLYVSHVTASQATQAIAGVRDLPVLTIGDGEGFSELGGIAQFFFEHGQLRFTVDLACAKRARLQISSRLLILRRQK